MKELIDQILAEAVRRDTEFAAEEAQLAATLAATQEEAVNDNYTDPRVDSQFILLWSGSGSRMVARKCASAALLEKADEASNEPTNAT